MCVQCAIRYDLEVSRHLSGVFRSTGRIARSSTEDIAMAGKGRPDLAYQRRVSSYSYQSRMTTHLVLG